MCDTYDQFIETRRIFPPLTFSFRNSLPERIFPAGPFQCLAQRFGQAAEFRQVQGLGAIGAGAGRIRMDLHGDPVGGLQRLADSL